MSWIPRQQRAAGGVKQTRRHFCVYARKTTGTEGKTGSSRRTGRQQQSKTDRKSKPHKISRRQPKQRAGAAKPKRIAAWRKIDGALVAGDVWIMTCLQLSSSVFPPSDVIPFGAVVITCWVATAALRGDYTSYEKVAAEGGFRIGWTVYTGVLQACFTWLFSTPVVMLAFAMAVTHGILDPAPVIEVETGAKVSPVLEVDVALLAVMAAWRGLYYALVERIL